MALIVETGALVAGAESYASVAYANSLHILLGNESWSNLDTSVKEQSLRKATQYMQSKYFSMWQGRKRDDDQSLDWPREGVVIFGTNSLVANSIIPNEIKNACCLLALRASAATLVSDKERAVKREKVDVLEVEYSEFDTSEKVYSEIDYMLGRYFTNASASGGGGLSVVRV